MHVDAVIPLYNGKKWIKEAIASVFKQTAKVGKVIVVDDGSTDGSYEFVSKVQGILLLRSPGKGPAAARNYGLEYTTAPYIAFLDQDDLWHPQHLELLIKVLQEHPETAMAAANYKSFLDGEEPGFDLNDRSVKEIATWGIYPNIYLDGCSPSFSLFRRKELIKIKWPEEHAGMCDYSLWLKLSPNQPLWRIAVKSVAYRRHHDSHTRVLMKDPLAYFDLWSKIADDLLGFYLQNANKPREKAMLVRQNSLVRIIEQLLIDLKLKKPLLVKKSLAVLNEVIREESHEYQDLVFQEIFDFLSLDYFSGKDSRNCSKYYQMLLEGWPDKSSIARKIIIEKIINKRPGARFYLDYYFNRPWQYQRIIPLSMALKSKYQRKRKL